MILPPQVRLFARYGRWMNEQTYAAAGRLDDAGRKLDRGAFFKSIHATLNHLIWADQTLLARVSGHAPPPRRTIAEGLALHDDFADLTRERARIDAEIVAWADGVRPADLEGDCTWRSVIVDGEITRPRWMLVCQLFNHGTHHRGQIHQMLCEAGQKVGDTDLVWMPAELFAEAAI